MNGIDVVLDMLGFVLACTNDYRDVIHLPCNNRVGTLTAATFLPIQSFVRSLGI